MTSVRAIAICFNFNTTGFYRHALLIIKALGHHVIGMCSILQCFLCLKLHEVAVREAVVIDEWCPLACILR